jgi:hypothetical protein
LLRTHAFVYVHWEPGFDSIKIHHLNTTVGPKTPGILRRSLHPGRMLLFLAIDSPHPFPSLRTIKSHADQATLPQVSMILSKTQALRSFKLYLRRDQYPTTQYSQYLDRFMSTTSSSVPYLEVYSGPHELLGVIRG